MRKPESPATRAARPAWNEEVRPIAAAGADELEGETVEEAEDLDIESLSDDEEPELPAEAPAPEEDDSEW